MNELPTPFTLPEFEDWKLRELQESAAILEGLTVQFGTREEYLKWIAGLG